MASYEVDASVTVHIEAKGFDEAADLVSQILHGDRALPDSASIQGVEVDAVAKLAT